MESWPRCQRWVVASRALGAHLSMHTEGCVLRARARARGGGSGIHSQI